MTEVGARDRLVMAGLVVLGLLTVVAGVLSGRSTIDYVLGRDAREAALSWAGTDQHEPEPSKDRTLRSFSTRASRCSNPASVRQPIRQASEPAGQARPPRTTSPWSRTRSPDHRLGLEPHLPIADEFVSKLDGFAVLGADQTPLAVGGDLVAAALKDMLAQARTARQRLRSPCQRDARR